VNALTGRARSLLVVELIVGLAMPTLLLLTGVLLLPVMLPTLIMGLTSDMVVTSSFPGPMTLPTLVVGGVLAGAAGLYAVWVLSRHALRGTVPKTSRAVIWAMLSLGIGASILPLAIFGYGRPLMWLMYVVLPLGVVGHLVYLSRELLLGAGRA
jgi:hypothetical protein